MSIVTRVLKSGKQVLDVQKMVNGRRFQERFATLGEAKAREAQLDILGKNAAQITLSPKQSVEARTCIEKLALHPGWTLARTVDYCLQHVIPFEKAPTVSEIVEEMIAESARRQKDDEVSSLTVNDQRWRLRCFSRELGARQLSSITPQEIKTWLSNPAWGPTSRDNYRRQVSMLFNYALRQDPPWVQRNPVKQVERRRSDHPKSETPVFTVDEAKSLLEHAAESDLLPFVAIALFSGVRTEELKRLDWADVKWSSRRIIIPQRVAKARRRRAVTINDSLAAWLAPYVKNEGSIVPPNLRWRREAVAKAAGVNWKRNGLRHSFASYHLAMWRNAADTALEIGHRGSIQVLFDHYVDVVSKEEAERYWSLRSSIEDNKALRLVA